MAQCAASVVGWHTVAVGQREENKARTRAALVATAVELFLDNGYDNVTMTQIADAAGVSRRTAYRYFATKDEMAMYHPNSWLDVFDQAAARHADLPLGPRLRAVSHDIAAHIAADPVPVRQTFAVTTAFPSLASAYAATTARWIDRVSNEIERDGSDTPERALRARVLAAAVMGMIDKVCRLWAESDHTADGEMDRLIDVGFDLLAEAFNEVEHIGAGR